MIEDDEYDPDDEAVKDSVTAAKYWHGEIGRAEKEFKFYHEKCDKIVKRYRDERDANRENAKRFNILWSNIQTMKPAVYAKVPKPIIERRFLERNDTERVAGIALQRAVAVELETGDFEDAVGGKQGAVMDYLLFSRGVVWVRYEADLNTKDESTPLTDIPDGGSEEVEQEESSLPTITAERLCIDFVHRKDYICDPCRTEKEIRWKAKRSWLTKRQAKDKFGEEIAGKVEYRQINDDNRYDDKQTPKERRAEFWEIWDKVRRKVWVINPGYDDVCKVSKDPLGLKNFWPCPKPLYGTMTSDSLVPIPDYVEYQDQAEQLDELSQRMSKIAQAIKAAGVYDASVSEIQRLMEFGTDNKLIPVESWALVKDKGGLEGVMDFLPLKDLIDTLNTLQEVFDQQLQRLYEITGIADIIRGNTSPEETYGAQKIKGQFATLRLQERQREVASFCREIVAIMTELIAMHFEPETIAAMTGLGDQNSPDAQYFQQAMELVGDARLRSFRVDIETNSTIELDVQEDKQSTTEFINGVAQFLNQVMPAAEKMPQLITLAGSTLLWGVRRMRTGRELEGVFERAVDDLTRMSQTGQLGQQQQANPEIMKIQAQREADQANFQLEQMKMQSADRQAQNDNQFEMLKHKNDMELQWFTAKQNLEIEKLKQLGQAVQQEKQHGHEKEIEAIKAQNQAGLQHDAHVQDRNKQMADHAHQKQESDKQLAAASMEGEKDRTQVDKHKAADMEAVKSKEKEQKIPEVLGKKIDSIADDLAKIHSKMEEISKPKSAKNVLRDHEGRISRIEEE